jgi:hypothetical protein
LRTDSEAQSDYLAHRHAASQYLGEASGIGRTALPGCELPRVVNRRNKMLWTIAVILLVLWVLGLVSSYTLGGFIHVLLVVALVVFLVGIIQGRRV